MICDQFETFHYTVGTNGSQGVALERVRHSFSSWSVKAGNSKCCHLADVSELVFCKAL
jgi:hypothetical protein